jgi:hypothetical protein
VTTATSTVRGNALAANERGFLESVQGPEAVSQTHMSAAETVDMSPRTRTIIYLSLLAGVLFLGSIAAYVWYGFNLWRNIP